MSHASPCVVRIRKARTTLLLDQPFFGTLLFRLGAKARTSIPTMATDGVSLFFNPDFVATLSAAELAGTLAHEVMHPALQHHTRRGARDARLWNMACDYAINPLLLDAGLTLPKGVLLERRYRGMSAEQIYSLLSRQQDHEEERKEKNQKGDGDKTGSCEEATAATQSSPSQDGEDAADSVATPGGIGQVLDAPEEPAQSPADQELDWQF